MPRRSDETLRSIPEVHAASPLVANELSELLAKAHAWREASKQYDVIKARITEIILEQGLASEDGLNGARTGPFGVIISRRKGRRYLDRELLVEAGVTPKQIDAGMKQAKDSTVVELFEIGANWMEAPGGEG